VSWSDDPNNCGSCGNSCQGATCTAGFCAGIPIVTQYANDRPIALDANNVYFTSVDNTGSSPWGISSVPKAGGAAIVLAPYDVADGIALDATYVYFTFSQNGIVARVPKDGSAGPTTIATGTVEGLSGIGVDDTYVYYTDKLANAVYRVAKAGGSAPQALATGESEPTLLQVDANGVYFYDWQSVLLRRVALDGAGGALTLANVAAQQIAQSATDILYVSQTEVGSVPKSGGPRHPYIELPPLTGIAIAAFGNALYYSYDGNGPSNITSIDLPSGSSPNGYYEDWAGNVPTQLAVGDASWVYFVANGMVERVSQ
jgi:hypothetical protein